MKKLLIIGVLILASINGQSAALGEYFTYQGELLENNQPANGNYEISANLFQTQSGGISIGGDFDTVPVVNGLFSIEFDMGVVPFMGDEVWIELSVKPSGPDSSTDLPRQKITNAPYAIHTQFVGSSGVNEDAIQTAAVTTFKIADNAVTQDQLANSSVGTMQIINASITTALIADAAVTTAKIAESAVTTIKIADGSVNENKLANNSVTSSHIIDATIVAADIDNTSVQQRVTGTCAMGESIRAIAANGEVMCENDDIGVAGWGLTGNAGTTPATNFMGTTDNQAWILKVNNKQAMKIEPKTDDEINITSGHFSNSISTVSISSVIAGGGNAIGINNISESYSNISGGVNNTIGNDDANPDSGSFSAIVGGVNNKIVATPSTVNSQASAIGGGASNIIEASNGVIPGGSHNTISAAYGFAAGFSSNVNHVGSFVWNDRSDTNFNNGYTTTADNQFLIRSEGGVGIGTNAPVSPIHIKGQGTSTGSTTGSNEVVMTIEPKVSTGGVAMVINKLDAAEESALIFSTDGVPEYDIRSNGADALIINSYNFGNTNLVMRINDKATFDRIDFNTNLEPNITATYDFGSAFFRWKTLYSVDPLNSSSDKRLKDNIVDLQYGLSEIIAMRPVSYNWKEGETKKTHLGLIAQEVETLVPEVVSQTADEKHMRSMRYAELIPVLIKATQEQQILIEQQTQQIEKLQQLVNSLINKS